MEHTCGDTSECKRLAKIASIRSEIAGHRVAISLLKDQLSCLCFVERLEKEFGKCCESLKRDLLLEESYGIRVKVSKHRGCGSRKCRVITTTGGIDNTLLFTIKQRDCYAWDENPGATGKMYVYSEQHEQHEQVDLQWFKQDLHVIIVSSTTPRDKDTLNVKQDLEDKANKSLWKEDCPWRITKMIKYLEIAYKDEKTYIKVAQYATPAMVVLYYILFQ